MAKNPKLGLALSGGGFRATAFHLGVLKRLRELGVLGQVRVVSTVSGGSIVGAFWAYWLATNPTALDDPSEWSSFERRLIEALRNNLRGRIQALSGLAPGLAGFALVFVVTGSMDAALGDGYLWRLLAAGAGGGILAYIAWLVLSSRLLMHFYDLWLFDGAELHALRAARNANKHAPHPELFVNATELRSGQQILFSETVRGRDALWEGAKRVPLIGSFFTFVEHLATARGAPADEPKRTIQLSTNFAQAVTASSTVPGVFPPLRVGGPLDSALRIFAQRFPGWRGARPAQARPDDGGKYLAVDGGVFDNQGTEALLAEDCTRIIISDAAAALRPKPRLSRRFVPVLARSQDIIYERIREAGYRQLKLRHNIHRLVEGVVAKRLDKKTAARWRRECGPLVEGYCYIQLLPTRDFKYQDDVSLLPRELHKPIANIRTDLDRFSDIEISALMYHGYTLIDHCLKGYNKRWIPNKDAEQKFHCGLAGIDIDWPNLSDETLARYANHLSASGSRIACRRYLQRGLGTLSLWLSRPSPGGKGQRCSWTRSGRPPAPAGRRSNTTSVSSRRVARCGRAPCTYGNAATGARPSGAGCKTPASRSLRRSASGRRKKAEVRPGESHVAGRIESLVLRSALG